MVHGVLSSELISSVHSHTPAMEKEGPVMSAADVLCPAPTETFRPPIFESGPDKRGFHMGRYNNFCEVFGDSKIKWFLPVFSRCGAVGDGRGCGDGFGGCVEGIGRLAGGWDELGGCDVCDVDSV